MLRLMVRQGRKETIRKLSERRKGYIYVDTGAMYRGMAIHFLDKGIRAEETDKIVNALKDAEVTIRYEEGLSKSTLNGRNITDRLRGGSGWQDGVPDLGDPQVRQKLLELQKGLARTQDVIMDGRDIGTCVLPDADVKIYLTASVETKGQSVVTTN